MVNPDHFAPIASVARAFRPALNDVVLVGGWAHQFHRIHRMARSGGGEALTTNDCDLAVPTRFPDPGHPTLAERIEKEGYTVEFSDDLGRGLRKYRSVNDPTFSLDVITPRQGDGRSRSGQPQEIWEYSGIQAEALRYVGLAFVHPWRFPLDIGEDETVELQVIHPMPFLIGKMLVSRASDRPTDSQAKDLFYAIETLSCFEDSLEDEEFREIGAEALASLPRKWREQFKIALESHFAGDADQPGATLVAAARIGAAAGRTTLSTPQGLRSVGRYGFRHLFDWNPTD